MFWTAGVLCQTPTLFRVVAVGFGPLCHYPTPVRSRGRNALGRKWFPYPTSMACGRLIPTFPPRCLLTVGDKTDAFPVH